MFINHKKRIIRFEQESTIHQPYHVRSKGSSRLFFTLTTTFQFVVTLRMGPGNCPLIPITYNEISRTWYIVLKIERFEREKEKEPVGECLEEKRWGKRQSSRRKRKGRRLSRQLPPTRTIWRPVKCTRSAVESTALDLSFSTNLRVRTEKTCAERPVGKLLTVSGR